jgi:hypothetical protein
MQTYFSCFSQTIFMFGSILENWILKSGAEFYLILFPPFLRNLGIQFFSHVLYAGEQYQLQNFGSS